MGNFAQATNHRFEQLGRQGQTVTAGNQDVTDLRRPPDVVELCLEFLIGDGTNAITAGLKPTAVVNAPRAGTITSWTILSCDAASPILGKISIDVWKVAYASYPPTAVNTICGGGPTNPPVITSSAIQGQSSTLTYWTTSFSLGDIFFVYVNSVTSFTAVKLIISYTG